MARWFIDNNYVIENRSERTGSNGQRKQVSTYKSLKSYFGFIKSNQIVIQLPLNYPKFLDRFSSKNVVPLFETLFFGDAINVTNAVRQRTITLRVNPIVSRVELNEFDFHDGSK